MVQRNSHVRRHSSGRTRTCTHADAPVHPHWWQGGPFPWNSGDASPRRTLLPSSVHHCCCRRKYAGIILPSSPQRQLPQQSRDSKTQGSPNDWTTWAICPEPWFSPTMWGWAPWSISLLSTHPGAMSWEETLLSSYDILEVFNDWFQRSWNTINRFRWDVFSWNFLKIQGALGKSPFKVRDPKGCHFKQIYPSNAEVNIWPEDFQQKPWPRNLRYGQAGIQISAAKQEFLHTPIRKKKKDPNKPTIKKFEATLHAVND